MSISSFLFFLLFAFVLSNGQSASWKTFYYGTNISAPCIVKKNATTSMICGGKSGSTGLNTCNEVTMNLNGNGFTYSAAYTVKKSTVLVGMYTAASKFWTTTQNEGGYSNKKTCILNLNDGTNSPKCFCCSNDNIVSSNMQCNDLTLTSECKQVFESCVIYDNNKERLIQIGGLLTSTYYNNITCFNITSESYYQCEYGSLNISTWYSGCTMTHNAASNEHTIIVAGGGSSSGGFIKDIQICENDKKNCYLAQTKLPIGLQEARLYNVDNCNILIIGGRRTSSLFYNGIITYDACNDIIVSQNDTILLQEKSEFSLYIGNGYMCTLGGLTGDGKYLSNIDCTLLKSTPQPTTAKPTTLMPTNKPTMKPTTKDPTRFPTYIPTSMPTTSKPTNRPTLAPTFSPTSASVDKMELGSWTVMGNYTTARSSQACMATTGNDQYAYVFGGLKWTSANAMSSSNEFYRVNISNNQILLNKYTATKTYWGLSKSMDEFYCQHQCSATYGNKVYIVSPFIVTDANSIYFYECTVDNDNLLVSCNNLCGTTNFCNNIPFEPCVTYFDNYLYIVGGQTASYIKNTILIYDMKNGSWVDNKSVLFGNLATGVAKPSCSVWNNTLYVFGGYSNVEATNIIQICNMKGGCWISNTKLSMPRFYSQASQAIGSSIVVTCGGKNYSHATDVVEVFDASNNSISIGANLADGNRKECCLLKLNNNLMISGGQSVGSTTSIGKNSLLVAPFTTTSTNMPVYLWECDQIEAEIPDLYSGKNTFTYQSTKMNGYQVWTSGTQYAIWYNPNATKCCWIGSTSNMGYNYYNEFDSGYWIFTVSGRAKRYSISMTCARRIVVGDDDIKDNTIMGINIAIFFVGLCAICVFLVCLIIGCFVCYKKRQEKSSNFQPGVSKTYSGQQPVVYHTISGGSQNAITATNTITNTTSDNSSALSSTMLFGNPKDPKWKQDVQHAIVKVEDDDDNDDNDNNNNNNNNNDNDDNQIQVEDDNVKFVNNSHLQKIEGYLQREQEKQNFKNAKITAQDLFPANQQ